MNHLLKRRGAPAATGRVCVPVDADKPEQFDVAAPTLREVAEAARRRDGDVRRRPPTTTLTDEGVDAFLTSGRPRREGRRVALKHSIVLVF